ncbi:MAG TPA: sugar phosphate isomerase/epimerase [Gemmatimonadaceae bacterium]|nr:sugar phosphate isomerase/epimerase [Gemmatimonadaceae bacterium]
MKRRTGTPVSTGDGADDRVAGSPPSGIGPSGIGPSGIGPHAMQHRTDRRSFLVTASASVGALLIGCRQQSLSAASDSGTSDRGAAASAQRIGIQLYTVRDLLGNNFDHTLQQVAAIGYKEVELAGLYDKSPESVRKTLDKLGLTAPSAHIPYDRLRSNLPGVAEEARVLGHRYVICPWLDAAVRRDADAYRRIAADFNKFGESLQRLGLQFGYHNHDFEFAKLPGGEIGYDILLADCDPKLVKMELDLYWITKAGSDPLAYFEKWPGRFPCVHVKDMTGNGSMANVGQGSIDWERIFAKRREAGIEHFFVEHDNPKSPLEDIKVSYNYMARLGL